MLSVALPQTQLTAVTIAQARTVMAVMISKLARLITRGQHKRQAYDDNAVGGIVEDTAHAVMISKLALCNMYSYTRT